MRSHRAYEFDNRDSAQMYDYLEARIDAMKRRIAELEMENARLLRPDVVSLLWPRVLP
jgi:hypothetical protein